ncbi:hypothetical protein [Kocuria turfanensis]|uniref:Uncharacterized protein n=1 Tax=Kocuria turfanensis TaxID=388357 RepID=A0A512IG72_9MICC|nr:hypothetical protein [Kocuria turfanensis]GEO96650.1 hypothetical protein KTU01_27730 [Kocuria turfanensis]
MATSLYEWMTVEEAADALHRYLAERAPALDRLREALARHGRDPKRVLNGSPESVAPLWQWLNTRFDQLGVAEQTLEEDPTRGTWPSWARHGKLVDPHPPAETIALVDGFVTYLGELLTAAVPGARWQAGEHRIAHHPLLNYPVLAAGRHQVFLPAMPLYSAYQSAHGRDPMSGAEMLGHVHRTIAALRGESPAAATAGEPLVNVVAEVGCFDVGLRADLVEQHPEVVERLVAELADRDGVVSVHRYGPHALVVDVPDWDELRLQLWLTVWLERALSR